MSYETLTGGLELVIPNTGTTNWGAILRNQTWVKINNHTHTGGGDGNLLTGSAFADNSIGTIKLVKNLALSVAPAVTVVGGVNTAIVDWNNGNKVTVDATAADGVVTPTLGNPVDGAQYRLIILQGATPQVWAWPANVKWPGGEEPTQFSEASEEIMIIFEYDGANFIGTWEIYNY